jgi:hypothetical protein
MLAIGCSSGDVPIELTFLLPLIAGTLSFNIDVSISDPKVGLFYFVLNYPDRKLRV